MSGKYAKKKKSRSKQKRSKILWIVCLVLVAALVAMLLFIARMETRDPGCTLPAGTEAGEEVKPSEHATEPAGQEQSKVTAPVEGLDLGSGVLITEYLPYTGAFMEDRTDAVVSDVLAIRVTNTGEEYIQTMNITLMAGNVEAQFSLSTLFPGDTVIVLEKNRMAYSSAPEFTDAKTDSVALFEERPGFCEDQLEIQCLNGVINITNISGQDIEEDIFVYYKNYVDGVYYGGITYRIRIQGGLRAGEVRQGAAAHFHPDNSTVVFVTCG